MHSILRPSLSALSICLMSSLAPDSMAMQTGGPCDRCLGETLPGRVEWLPDCRYRIDSDLPEMFTSSGVLYTTRTVLPPFRTKDGLAVSLEQRTQRNLGFSGIDDSFEVFLYHLNYAGVDSRDRKIVVYAHNPDQTAALIRVKSMIEAQGVMATADGPESRLAVRSLESDWDESKSLEIPGGHGRVIARTPTLSDPKADTSDPDRTSGDFVTGLVRGEVATPGANKLELSVIAIPANTPMERIDEVAASMLETGAMSAEEMDLNIAPPECHVRRVSGVSRHFLWRGEPRRIDVSTLGSQGLVWRNSKGESKSGPSGIAFLMAAPRVQTENCPQSRQTIDMLMHPGYVHPETIGNYQTEYLVTFILENPSDRERLVDVRFGKFDADIGLAWQYEIGEGVKTRDELRAKRAQVQWAGAWRNDDLPDDTRSFFDSTELGVAAKAGAVAIPAKSARTVSLRFVPVGTSSMPFMLFIVPADD